MRFVLVLAIAAALVAAGLWYSGYSVQDVLDAVGLGGSKPSGGGEGAPAPAPVPVTDETAQIAAESFPVPQASASHSRKRVKKHAL